MKTVILKKRKVSLTWVMLVMFINVWCIFEVSAMKSDDGTKVEEEGDWGANSNGNKALALSSISIYQYSNHLTIQDSNPVNTITVKITCNETGAVVFENVYPKGQTSLIVIPMNGWSAGSYTIELFGKENNGYLWAIFQVLP